MSEHNDSEYDDFIWSNVFSSVEIQGKFVDKLGNDIDIRPMCKVLAAIASTLEIRKESIGDFIITDPKISPPLVIHANLKPDAYVHLRTKRINFNIGIILSADSLPNFLGQLQEITIDPTEKSISLDDLSRFKPNNEMLNELHQMLIFWDEARKRKNEYLVIPGDEWIGFHISERMLTFLFIHELSHWSVNIYKEEVRNRLKDLVRLEILDAFSLFNSKGYFLEEARLFRENEKVRERWVEEMFADKQAFQYCLDYYHAGWSSELRKVLYYSITLVYVMTSMAEFFWEKVLGVPLVLTHPHSYLRKQLLAYIVCKNFFDMSLQDFYQKEWGIFLITEMLLQSLLDKYYEAIRK